MMPGRKMLSSLWVEMLPVLWFVQQQAWMERWLGSQLILFRALVMIEESREGL